MTSESMDRHGLRPRDDCAGSRSVCAPPRGRASAKSSRDDGAGSRSVCAPPRGRASAKSSRDDGAGSRSVCSIGPDSGAFP
ncbi:MAG: hypothetical protein WA012_11265 [Rhodoferax sp.]